MLKKLSFELKALSIVFIIILTLLPFHALLSTLLISHFGFELPFKAWKEILIFLFGIPLLLLAFTKDKNLYKTIMSRKINQLVIAYFVVTTILFLLYSSNGLQSLAGYVINLRFLVIFIVAQVLAFYIPYATIKPLLLKIVIIGALIVMFFGALQVLLLPKDFLTFFGYSDEIIPPYSTIDNNDSLVRIISTVRGPNVLGSYIVLIAPFFLIAIMKLWKSIKYGKLISLAIIFVTFVTLFGSHSRSAYIGLFFTSLFIAYFYIKKRKIAKGFVYLTGGALIVLVAPIILFWATGKYDVYINHVDPADNSSQLNSNEERLKSLTGAMENIVNNPFGSGLGSIGPGSNYGSNPRITENYPLQVGQEVGLIGLIILFLIFYLILKELAKKSVFLNVDLALLSGFVGLIVISMFWPVFTDETVSMIWWGLAGALAFNKSRSNTILE